MVVANTAYSKRVCSVCPGDEVIDGEYRFSTGDLLRGNRVFSFGPCRGITVYRYEI